MLNIPVINLPDSLTGQLLTYFPYYGSWSIEPYIKCSYKCTYCFSDAQGVALSHTPLKNIEDSLDRDFSDAAQYPKIFNHVTPIILSCHTDPYQPIENITQITRQILYYLIKKERDIIIVTRSPLILRDMDLLASYKNKVKISISLSFAKQEFIDKYESGAPTLSERLETINYLCKAGMDLTVRISPWLPYVTDTRAIFKLLPKEARVLVSPLHLNDSTASIIDKSKIPSLDNQDSGSLMKKMHALAMNGGSMIATKYFSHLSQEEIFNEYIKERNLVGFRQKTLWDYPIWPDQAPQKNNIRHLKPDELQPRMMASSEKLL